MNKADTIKKCFNILESEYGIQTEYKKEVWANILRGYPAEKIMRATIKYLETSRFFPFVSDIIKLIEGNRAGEAEKAWSNLIEDIIDIGYYGTPSKWKKDKIVEEIVEILGGWQKVCDIKEDEIKWVRREFIVLYKTIKEQKQIGREEILALEKREQNRNQIEVLDKKGEENGI
jgi:hypothetical protein